MNVYYTILYHAGAEWPFITALYFINSSEYFCGETIIFKKHVLTGNNNFVVASLNKLTKTKDSALTAKDEKHVVRKMVTNIMVHD